MLKKILSLFIFFLVSCGTSNNVDISKFSVNEGDSITRVTTRLTKDGIISNPQQFRILAKLTGKESKLKIGTYQIPPKTSFNNLLNILISGKSITTAVTIPEGYNIFQIATLLEEQGIVNAKEFLIEVYSSEWLNKFNIPTNTHTTITNIKKITDQNGNIYTTPLDPPSYSLEGYLFPDTYVFEKNTSAKTIVQTMTKRFEEIIDSNILAQIKKQNKTLHDTIIMASIIQKEATHKNEMPKVAGVYQNRQNINMILQADPTLIYALILDGEYNGNIRTKHLRPAWPSPYNTYHTIGLPLGAIANPGKEAILAAINPDNHDYFYFVGSPDGEHNYSRTYKEHKQAVQKWIQHRRDEK